MTMDARRHPRLERGLAIAAIVGGVLAAMAGSPTRSARGSIDVGELARVVEHEEDHVTATELATWIRDDKRGLRVIDIRPDSEFDAMHIPSARRASLSELARMPIDSAATYVLYSGGGAHAAQGWVLLRARGVRTVYFLSGGLNEWIDQIMSPRVPASMPQAQRDSIRALTLWFGGKMQVVDSAAGPLDTREAIRRIRRRAC